VLAAGALPEEPDGVSVFAGGFSDAGLPHDDKARVKITINIRVSTHIFLLLICSILHSSLLDNVDISGYQSSKYQGVQSIHFCAQVFRN
jgi:hypothetical protein